MPVTQVDHPLIRHKLGLLRDVQTTGRAFRALTAQIAMLLAAEATADLSLGRATAACWSGPLEVDRLDEAAITVVPILRAGLGMLDGVLGLLPDAGVSMVGVARDHATLRPQRYLERLVDGLERCTALIVDPMLATAGSLIATVDLLKQRGCTDIRALVLVAAPEGVRALHAVYPEVRCWAAAVDSHLDAAGYIIPGLGDAGDRLYGTP